MTNTFAKGVYSFLIFYSVFAIGLSYKKSYDSVWGISIIYYYLLLGVLILIGIYNFYSNSQKK